MPTLKTFLSLAILSATYTAVISGNDRYLVVPDNHGKPTVALLGQPGGAIPPAKDLAADVRFHLYTRSNPMLSARIYVNDTNSLAASYFDPNNPTKIIAHGFTNDINSDAIQIIKNAYLPLENVNVVGVDWGVLAAGPWYNEAKGHVTEVGDFVGQLVDFLVRSGAKYEDFHLMGHSLGAHVAGVAGAHATQKVTRVTGLDPALPLFGNNSISEKLDPTDANFVDVIHTCGGDLGFMDPIGQADFYPNGGTSPQPGCGIIDIGGSCSHGKAYEFFAESVLDSSKFSAYKCATLSDAETGNCASTSTGHMGAYADPSMQGLYHLVAK